MKNIKIVTELINELNEKTNCNTEGYYNQKKQEIIFYEHNIKVNLQINDNEINIIREHPQYILQLCFINKRKIETNYIVKNINLKFNLLTETLSLIIKTNTIEIKYKLFLNDQDMGIFYYKIYYEVIK
ncbi:MAG: DUF1934 family protein [Bacilli bacterium]|nr:DUF1934 family protein [Bacilli bacterium]